MGILKCDGGGGGGGGWGGGWVGLGEGGGGGTCYVDLTGGVPLPRELRFLSQGCIF